MVVECWPQGACKIVHGNPNVVLTWCPGYFLPSDMSQQEGSAKVQTQISASTPPPAFACFISLSAATYSVGCFLMFSRFCRLDLGSGTLVALFSDSTMKRLQNKRIENRTSHDRVTVIGRAS